MIILPTFMRITKPGGVIFIDHESSPQAWMPSPVRDAYLKHLQARLKSSFFDRWGPKCLLQRVCIKLKKLGNPRYQIEGDIHVWDDDHIDWDNIENILKEQNVDITRSDYLVCRVRGETTPLYDNYKSLYFDMSMLIGRKKYA